MLLLLLLINVAVAIAAVGGVAAGSSSVVVTTVDAADAAVGGVSAVGAVSSTTGWAECHAAVLCAVWTLLRQHWLMPPATSKVGKIEELSLGAAHFGQCATFPDFARVTKLQQAGSI